LIVRTSCGTKLLKSDTDIGYSQTTKDHTVFLKEFEDTVFAKQGFELLFRTFLKAEGNDSQLQHLFIAQTEKNKQISGNNQLMFEFLDYLDTQVLSSISEIPSLKKSSKNFFRLYQKLVALNQKDLVGNSFKELNALHDYHRHHVQMSMSTKQEDWRKVLVDVLEKWSVRAYIALYDNSGDADNLYADLVVASGQVSKDLKLPIRYKAANILPFEFSEAFVGKLYLIPLYLGRETYGFMLIDGNDPQMLEYESFAHGLSIAIRNSIQMERLEQHTLELEKANDNLATLAQYDSLTELPNRSLLKERLELACKEAKKCNTQVGLLFLDLDGFKYINDSLGHSAGDELLKLVSKRLRSQIRSVDTVARLGGDEFTIVVNDIDGRKAATRMAENIVALFNEPFKLEEGTFRVTTSVGVALFPYDDHDPEELMKHADAAMYKAKSDGKNRYYLYNSSLSEEAAEQIRLAEEMRGALEREEFSLAFQPRFDMKHNSICGFEALARWRNQDGIDISPVLFIPVAEKLGLIHQIGQYVLKRACIQAKYWSDHIEAVNISVNLSANQLHEDDIVEQIAGILDEVGLEPYLLELEITESAAMIDIDKNIKKLQKLRDMGLKIALDDFGTAYSSLNYLKRLPVTSLKIDQSFVQDIQSANDSSNNTAIIRAVIALGKSMGFTLVAEGVETEVQLDFLKRYHCDEIQGYLLSRPVPAEQANALLSSANQTYVKEYDILKTKGNFLN